MNNETELFSPTFNAIFPTLDEMIKHVSSDVRIRKVYSLLRTKGLSEYEAQKYLYKLLQEIK
jgi:hypothetical protein